MTEEHLRHIEALSATLVKLDSIPRTSGYYKLASEYVPELIAEVRDFKAIGDKFCVKPYAEACGTAPGPTTRVESEACE